MVKAHLSADHKYAPYRDAHNGWVYLHMCQDTIGPDSPSGPPWGVADASPHQTEVCCKLAGNGGTADNPNHSNSTHAEAPQRSAASASVPAILPGHGVDTLGSIITANLSCRSYVNLGFCHGGRALAGKEWTLGPKLGNA